MPPGTTRVTLRKLLVWPGNVEEFFECDWRWPDLHEETEVGRVRYHHPGKDTSGKISLVANEIESDRSTSICDDRTILLDL